MRRTRQHRTGFTLVELLVVIAIIGVLLGLLLPAVQAAREAARRTQCKNKIKQIGLALQNYHGQFGQFPTAGRILPSESSQLESIGWRVLILPFLEMQQIYNDYELHSDGTWSSAAHHELELIDAYLCPTAEPQDPDPTKFKVSNYAAVAGGNTDERIDLMDVGCGDIEMSGIFYPDSHTKISLITDGTSNTLAAGERIYFPNAASEKWTSGAVTFGDPPLIINTGATKNVRYPINADHYKFGFYMGDSNAPAGAPKTMVLNDLPFASLHPGGAHFAYADGSVQFLDDTIDFTVYQALSTKAGGEVSN